MGINFFPCALLKVENFMMATFFSLERMLNVYLNVIKMRESN